MEPRKYLRIDRNDARATRFYAVLFVLLPVAVGVGLIWVDGLVAKLGMLACAGFAFQSIRANLGFAQTIELVDDRVLVHPLWSSRVRTLRGLREVVLRLAIARGVEPARLVVNHYTLRFPEGPVLVQTSAFPGANELLAALLGEVCGAVTFPLQLGESVMQHWTASPVSSGAAAAYHHVGGTLVTISVIEAKDGADVDDEAVEAELESALASFRVVCAKKSVVHEVSAPSTASLGGLQFRSASMVAGRGAKAARSQLFLTAWEGRFFKVRVANAPRSQVGIDVATAAIEAFLKANGRDARAA